MNYLLIIYCGIMCTSALVYGYPLIEAVDENQYASENLRFQDCGEL